MNSVEFKSDRTKPATKSYKNYDNLFVYDTRNLLSNSIDIKYKKNLFLPLVRIINTIIKRFTYVDEQWSFMYPLLTYLKCSCR